MSNFLFSGANSQRSQTSVADSGYGSNSSFNSTGSRGMSTQATQRSVADMFSPNTMRVTSQSSNLNSQQNRTNIQNSFNSNNSRIMNGVNNSNNPGRPVPVGRGNSRPPLAVVTGNTINSGNRNSGNSGNNFNQSRTSSYRLPTATGDAGDTDGNEIVCNCGNDALQLTVRKEGPNTGKQ